MVKTGRLNDNMKDLKHPERDGRPPVNTPGKAWGEILRRN